MLTKKGEKQAGNVVHELPQILTTQVVRAPAQTSQIVPTSNARETSFMAPTETKKRRIRSLSQIDEDVKRMKFVEVRRQERQDIMDKEIAE